MAEAISILASSETSSSGFRSILSWRITPLSTQRGFASLAIEVCPRVLVFIGVPASFLAFWSAKERRITSTVLEVGVSSWVCIPCREKTNVCPLVIVKVYNPSKSVCVLCEVPLTLTSTPASGLDLVSLTTPEIFSSSCPKEV